MVMEGAVSCEDREAVVGQAGFEVGSEEYVGGLEVAVYEPRRLVDVT